MSGGTKRECPIPLLELDPITIQAKKSKGREKAKKSSDGYTGEGSGASDGSVDKVGREAVALE